MPVYRYDNGIADLTHTNMCYRCDWCDQGYNRIIHLNQVGVEYFMCDRCRSYYKLTWSQLDRLKYIEIYGYVYMYRYGHILILCK